MGMMSLSLYLAFVFFGGSMGIPMGMPPGPEDPMMAKFAPQECSFYASWSGVAKTDPKANPSEKWMAQPVTGKAIPKLRRAYRGYLLSRAEAFEPAAKLSTRMLVEVIDAGSVNPAGVYIDKLNIDKDSFSLRAAVMVSLGNWKAEVKRIFEELHTLLSKNATGRPSTEFSAFRALVVDGEKVIELSSIAEGLPIFVALRGEYFLLGVGKDSLADVAKNTQTPPPKWLSEMKARLKIDRVASIAFVDFKEVQELFRLPIWEFGMGTSFADFFQDIKSAGWISGMDAKGCLTRAEIKTGEQVKGLLSVIDLKPIPEHFLKDVPADTTVGLASRLSTKRILEMVKKTAENAGQNEPLNDTLGKFQRVTGVSLEQELLEAVGDYVHAYYTLDLGNWNSGWIVSVRIDDEMSFPAIFDQINQGLKRWIEDLDQSEFSVVQHGLHEIYSVKTQVRSANFSWALVDDQWYFASQAADIIKHLEGQPDDNQYLNDSTVKEIFEFGDQNGFGGPVAIFHLNLPHLLEAARPFIEPALKSNDALMQGMDFRLNDIPPVDELVHEVRPNFMAVYRTNEGFQVLQRQTYPGSSPGVSFAALAIGALPTQMANMTGRSKLKLLGRAHLDFEKKHKHLCAAYSEDANGNALLSWRVHLLPTLGFKDLYDQFHLDEPWDSAHNVQLLDKMPNIYRHPSMKLDPNKTVYMALTGGQSAYGSSSNPTASPPLGIKLAKIEDELAETAMLIELGKNEQVFWTRPKDANVTGKDVRAKVQKIRDSRKFHLVLFDGTVDGLSAWTSPHTLDNLFDLDDGKPVGIPRNWIFW